MKNLLLALSLLAALPVAEAKQIKFSKQTVLNLAANVKQRREKVLKRLKNRSIPLVRFYTSPENPVAGDTVTIFAQMDTSFTDQETILLGSLDNQSAELDHPATELWVADLGSLFEIRAHSFKASVFIQNAADAQQIRNAITQLEADIAGLNSQIAEATDPALIAQLTAQRDDKVAQKNVLVQALADLKAPVGDEIFNFGIAENTGSANFPHISSVSPNVAKAGAPTTLTITGSNFGVSPTVLVGSSSLSVSALSATSITASSTGFNGDGARDIEVRYTANGITKNAFLKNAFFVTSENVGSPPNQKPVAVASAEAGEVNLGANATFISTGSYDPEGASLTYQWRLISKPTGSALQVPTDPVGTGTTFSITPDVPGTYVAELKTVESSAEGLVSAPSLAIVTALASSNAIPQLFGAPIEVNGGEIATLQLNLVDEAWQGHTFQVIRQGSRGEASVSSTGLVTYASYTNAGPDSFDVLVVDNGTPPLTATVTIPVSVFYNQAPSGSAPAISTGSGGVATSQIAASDADPGQTISYSISTPPTQGTAEVSASGLLTYRANAGVSGSDSIGVRLTDDGFPVKSTEIFIPVSIAANLPPAIPFPVNYFIASQGIPVQVSLSMASSGPTITPISDPDGTVASMVWDFGDGTKERTLDTSFGTLLHNYVAAGQYTATLTVTDNYGASTSSSVQVNVVDTDIPTIKFKVSPSNGGGGVVPLTITVDASGNSDADGITQYRWRWSGTAYDDEVTTSPINSHTYTSPGTYTIRVRARDGFRAQGQASVNVVVGSTSSGVSPIAQFTALPAREVHAGSPISLDGSRSFNANVGGTIAAYNWTFNDYVGCPSDPVGCSTTGLNTSYTYSGQGNFFVGLQVQSGGGGLSQRASQEMLVVNAGHAPHAVLRASPTSGVAPLTVSFDGSESYDYDGTLSFYGWMYQDGSPTDSGQKVSHTFTSPGVYLVRHFVVDSDGNSHGVNQTITVLPAVSALGGREKISAKPKVRSAFDPEREYQRTALTSACFYNDGAACSELADMYLQDGDVFTGGRLKTKACELGFSPACTFTQHGEF